ncbi:hypothetical protein C1646_752584 [Rhizophagus diaphanus]|nr:hypothetical protein C1646_752584 [Rhizophagus diaphanus] [Rhizophagus sp. MUCL 43196]
MKLVSSSFGGFTCKLVLVSPGTLGWSLETDSLKTDGWSLKIDGWNLETDGWSLETDGWSLETNGWSLKWAKSGGGWARFKSEIW